MITRKTLAALGIFTLVMFGIAAAVGNHHHGLRQVVADISWNGFLLGLLLTIIASVVVIVRASRGRARRAV
jgi:hypothetical protein